MIKDIFSYPMRIFFLLAAAMAAVGAVLFFTPVDFVSLHKFFFLHLVAGLAYAGFLLTGIPDWTNYGGAFKTHSWILFVVFVLAFFSSMFDLWVAHAFMWAFWLYLSGLCVYMIWLDRNENQFGVLGFLLLLLGFEMAFLLTGDEKFLNLQLHIHVIAILLVSFRVSVVLGKEALDREISLKDALFVPNLVYKNISITCVCAFLAISVILPNSNAINYAAMACGAAVAAKLKEWHFSHLLKHHFVLFYYALQFCVAAAYFAYGVSGILGLGLEINLLHIIAINGVFFTIMLIFNIAGLRHSGQSLNFLRLCKVAFLLLFLAGISRGVLGNFSIGFYIHLPAMLFIIAFGLWFYDFYKIFKNNDFSEDPE